MPYVFLRYVHPRILIMLDIESITSSNDILTTTIFVFDISTFALNYIANSKLYSIAVVIYIIKHFVKFDIYV